MYGPALIVAHSLRHEVLAARGADGSGGEAGLVGERLYGCVHLLVGYVRVAADGREVRVPEAWGSGAGGVVADGARERWQQPTVPLAAGQPAASVAGARGVGAQVSRELGPVTGDGCGRGLRQGSRRLRLCPGQAGGF